MDQIQYSYIAIEGNIGAGKTSFSRKLADWMSARLILESFEDNPFLPIFYENPGRFAFPVELHFLVERHRQMMEEAVPGNLFASRIVSDYCPQKSLVFAAKTLHPNEYRLMHSIYEAMYKAIPAPDIIMYINRAVPTLQNNISSRGRSYEQQIEDDYLQSIQDSYYRYFLQESKIPIFWIEAGDRDILNDPEVFKKLTEIFYSRHEAGFRQLEL